MFKNEGLWQVADSEWRYLLDADMLMHIHRLDDSQVVYDKIFQLSEVGRVKILRQVFDEIKSKKAVHQILSPHKKSLQFPIKEQYTVPIQDLIEYIQDNAGYLTEDTNPRNVDPADPWLIAISQEYGYVLVTDENPRSSKRIPFACRSLSRIKCRCISGPHFLYETGIITELKPEHISVASFYDT